MERERPGRPEGRSALLALIDERLRTLSGTEEESGGPEASDADWSPAPPPGTGERPRSIPGLTAQVSDRINARLAHRVGNVGGRPCCADVASTATAPEVDPQPAADWSPGRADAVTASPCDVAPQVELSATCANEDHSEVAGPSALPPYAEDLLGAVGPTPTVPGGGRGPSSVEPAAPGSPGAPSLRDEPPVAKRRQVSVRPLRVSSVPAGAVGPSRRLEVGRVVVGPSAPVEAKAVPGGHSDTARAAAAPPLAPGGPAGIVMGGPDPAVSPPCADSPSADVVAPSPWRANVATILIAIGVLLVLLAIVGVA